MVLHSHIFDQYQLCNAHKDSKPLTAFFKDQLPPGGSGDCAAPKLLQYANTHGLKVLALSEFWWGQSLKNEIRHHQQTYAPCRSKCHSILPFMLEGIDLEKAIKKEHQEPEIIYQDDAIIVLNKPSGMLSIPGKVENHSVLSWLKNKFPAATGALLLHRLDQDTSGVMLASKSAGVYKAIQSQFINRSIKKRYVALLEKEMVDESVSIELPLRVDLDDRPRQLVCHEFGKKALTFVSLINVENRHSRVYFYPKTGRTHQLRVHAAHEQGLSNPIVGDVLYGKKADRLMLHADKIEFYHPVKKQNCVFRVKVPF